MIRFIDNSLSALDAFQKKLDVAADNVANVNSDKFKASRTILKQDAGGGVAATVEKTAAPAPLAIDGGETVEKSNVNLAEEFVSMIEAKNGLKANIAAVKTSDEMIGEILNLKA